MDAARYLRAKNAVDDTSFNTEVWSELRRALKIRLLKKGVDKRADREARVAVRVVDLGAGLLNMLPRVTDLVQELTEEVGVAVELRYLAFEQSAALQADIRCALLDKGFIPSPSDDLGLAAGPQTMQLEEFCRSQDAVRVCVTLSQRDFMSAAALGDVRAAFASTTVGSVAGSMASLGLEGRSLEGSRVAVTASGPEMDLLLGCCVADLVEPSALCAQVMELAGDGGGLL